MSPPNSRVSDLRRYARQTNVRLGVGAVLLFVVLGNGLIYLIYGPGPAAFGLVCTLAGLAPLVLIWLALALIDWIVRRANEE